MAQSTSRTYWQKATSKHAPDAAITMITEFTDLVQHRALAMWASRGWDDANDSCYEALDPSGAPLADQPKRTRVQLRQIYVYAHAHSMGLRDSEALVTTLFDFLSIDALSKTSPGCAYLLSPSGQALDQTRDLYDQAFLILAAAWSYRAFGKQEYLTIAEETARFLDDVLKAPNGGWYESDREIGPQAGRRRQNPHMHLFEAFLALFEATQNDHWLSKAREILNLFEVHFYDPETECLLEFFSADWAPLHGDMQAVEPGHMLEWSWLLAQYQRLSGVDYSHLSFQLLSKGITLGLNAKTGLIYNVVEPDGRVSDSAHRLWPQTEYIKALIASIENGNTAAAPHLDEAAQALLTHFSSPISDDLWIERVDADGAPIDSRTAASSFYHMFCAAAEYSRFESTKP